MRLLANMPGNMNKIELPKILKVSTSNFKKEIISSNANIKGLGYNVTSNDLLKKYNALFK